jgi:DNA-binding transcriptional LysR family regulator
MTAEQSMVSTSAVPSIGNLNLASVDLNLLVALEALLEHRNVTYAGQRVGLSQPAMSRALVRLRGVFKDDLLVRTSTRFKLTARSEQLMTKLPTALGMIREILETKIFNPESAKSKITVAMPEHQALVLLPQLLPRLRARAPNVDVVVHSLLAG